MTSPVFPARTRLTGLDRDLADGEHAAMPGRNDSGAPTPTGGGRRAAGRSRDRDQRRAAALRENLRRRKAQARARSASDEPALDIHKPGGKAPVRPPD